MDDVLFDRLTRRFVLAGVAGGSLAVLVGFGEAKRKKAKKPSKRKRCKEKKREFCAGRCCPKVRRCVNDACVESCNQPFQCPPDGPADTLCGPEDACFCGKTPDGKSACVALTFPTDCNDLEACGSGTPCPSGQICFTCFCSNQATMPNFRCAPPC